MKKISIWALLLGLLPAEALLAYDPLGIDMASPIETLVIDETEKGKSLDTGTLTVQWLALPQDWSAPPLPGDKTFLEVQIPPGSTTLKYPQALALKAQPKALSFWAAGPQTGELVWEIMVTDRLGLDYYLLAGSSDQFWREFKVSLPPLTTYPVKLTGYRIFNPSKTPLQGSFNLVTLVTDTYGDQRDPDEIPGGW